MDKEEQRREAIDMLREQVRGKLEDMDYSDQLETLNLDIEQLIDEKIDSLTLAEIKEIL